MTVTGVVITPISISSSIAVWSLMTSFFWNSEGHLPVQESVVSQVHQLLAALAQELLDLVAAVGERGGLVLDLSGGHRGHGCWL